MSLDEPKRADIKHLENPVPACGAVGRADQRCRECGAFEAREFAGGWICDDCLQVAGTCGAGASDES